MRAESAAAGELQLNSQSWRESTRKDLGDEIWNIVPATRFTENRPPTLERCPLWFGLERMKVQNGMTVFDANAASGWIFCGIERYWSPRILITISDKWELVTRNKKA